jgi:hypothetical protein
MPAPHTTEASMSHETLQEKAARLLISGALDVHEVTGNRVRATCQGDSGRTWRLGWQPHGGWGCQCPSNQFRRACAHLEALRRVVADPTGETVTAPGSLDVERLRAAQREATSVRNGTRRTA